MPSIIGTWKMAAAAARDRNGNLLPAPYGGKGMGRVTFNPVKHIDPFGTILLPGILLLSHAPFLFGYAKPVPVNFRALRNPRRDMVWVAAAGPGARSWRCDRDRGRGGLQEIL